MLERHRQDKEAIVSVLRNPHDGPTVVMSHHLPVRVLIAPWRTIGGDQNRALNNGFAFDLWSEIKQHDIHSWICGHSHETRNWIGDGNKGQIRFVMNQRGYPGEEIGFETEFVVEF
ncbi:hypothetical protein [Aliiroseovarius sp. 2305UL8-7]|uniref:hypothetical protein n=1 Tax=Aliiroseovarius conchicola TaxID=3121637 RepID=UPI003528AE17